MPSLYDRWLLVAEGERRRSPAVRFADRPNASTFGDLASLSESVPLPEGPIVSCDPSDLLVFIASFLAARREGRVFCPFDRGLPQADRAAILERLLSAPLPAGTAMLKLTSGSSGDPRAIAVSEENLLADFSSIARSMRIGPDDTSLAAISLAHSYGFGNLVLPLVLQGSAIVVADPRAPRGILDAIASHRPTVVPLVPFQWEALGKLAGDWSSARLCVSAGAPLTGAVASAFHRGAGLKIHTFYGASECGGIAFDRTNDLELEPGYVGEALDGVAIDLDPEERVRVKSRAVALGYVLADSGAFSGGRFVTGDHGRFDPAGGLVLTGRAAGLINVGGQKVDPVEVESCLRGLPGVRDAVAVGVPDPHRGETVGALVLADRVEEEDALAWCRARLAPLKVPRRLVVVSEMPADDRGKAPRSRILSLLMDRTERG